MYRENYRQAGTAHRLQDGGKLFTLVHVGRTVQGHYEIRTCREVKLVPQRRLSEAAHVLHQRVDHSIADEEDLIVALTFSFEVFIGGATGSKEVVRDRVGYNAVDLFRHGHVARPDTALHMGDAYLEFFRNDGACER